MRQRAPVAERVVDGARHGAAARDQPSFELEPLFELGPQRLGELLALRQLPDQRVGVQLSGTALAPRLRLYADPDLPESEKLAWLVLGRPASGAGAEAAVLQQAALALLAGRDGRLDGGLANALGLDELSIAGSATNADGSAASAALTLGKRLSNNLYLSYERSLAGALGTVSIFYDVSRRLTVRARAGEENALDLIFTIQYD